MVFRKGILVMSSLLLSLAAKGESNDLLERADSLFNKGKYTESLELYNEILDAGSYSSSMLLKLSFIEEGLGNVGSALYYLNLYYRETSNKQALLKLEEIAKENQLYGYEYSDADFFINVVHRFNEQIIGFIGALALLLLGTIIYRRRNSDKKPFGLGVSLLLSLFLLFYLVNFGNGREQGIIIDQEAYLMTGPSAGSDVVEIVERGHRVNILGREGIWLKIKWRETEVYIRENKIKSLS